jgi:GT2 family glycosyltransferase
MVGPMRRRFSPSYLRKMRVYGWATSLLLGELRWLRTVKHWFARRTLHRDYPKWIAESEDKYGFNRDQDLKKFAPEINFEIIYRFESPSVEGVTRAVHGMLAQRFKRWKLHLLLANGLETYGLDQLDQLSREDERIHIWSIEGLMLDNKTFLESIRTFHSSHIIFLEEQGVLHPHALAEFTNLIFDEPEVDWIYTDQDQVDMKGNRFSPWLKPNWSPELLISINYLKPAVIRKEILEGNDIFWIDLINGSHWKSLLGIIDARNCKVLHLPKILYHVRTFFKAWQSQIPPDRDHFNWVIEYLRSRNLENIEVSHSSTGALKAVWSTSQPTVSIIIPTKDNLKVLRRCLDTLLDQTLYRNFAVTLVDTGSNEEETRQYYEELKSNPRIEILQYKKPFNYSAANNFGAFHSTGQLLLFLNNDIEIIDGDWLEELVRWAEWHEIGAVGAKLLYPDLSIQHDGVILGLGGHAGHVFLGTREGEDGPYGSTEWYRDYLAVSGACMMMRREVFNQVGGFDDSYQLTFSDVDLCLRVIEEGYRVMVTPFARLIHREGTTRQRYNPENDLLRAFDVFYPYLKRGDPYYNPNLSYSNTFPMLRSSVEEDNVERVKRIVGRNR